MKDPIQIFPCLLVPSCCKALSANFLLGCTDTYSVSYPSRQGWLYSDVSNSGPMRIRQTMVQLGPGNKPSHTQCPLTTTSLSTGLYLFSADSKKNLYCKFVSKTLRYEVFSY